MKPEIPLFEGIGVAKGTRGARPQIKHPKTRVSQKIVSLDTFNIGCTFQIFCQCETPNDYNK